MFSASRALALVLTGLASITLDAQSPRTEHPALVRAIDQINGLDVDALIAIGLRQSPALASADAMVAAAEGRQQQAGRRANPEFMFEQRQQLGGGDRETAVGVSWPLELNRVSSKQDAAGAEKHVADLDRLDARQRQAISIRTAYGRLLAAARSLAVTESQLDTDRDLLRLSDERARTGTGPALEREQAAIEVAMLTSRRDRLARDLEVARLAVAREAGFSAGSTLAVRGELEPIATAAAPPATTTGAAPVRGDVGKATASFDAAQARTRAAGAEGGFDLRLNGNYNYLTMSFPQLGFAQSGQLTPVAGRFHSIAGGVTIMLPIANGNQGGVAAAQAEETAAARRLDDTRRLADFDVAMARVWLDQAGASVAIIRDDALRRARANVAVVAEAYSLGARPLSDVLSETRRLQQIEAEYTDALLDLYEAAVSLRAATGDTGAQ
jgi:cobalt-zinc-cadmium efflux system outer membrane protein